MKKRAYLYAVVAIAVAVAAVIIVSYTLFGQGSPQLGQVGQAQEIVPVSIPLSSCPNLGLGNSYTNIKLEGLSNIKAYTNANEGDIVIVPGSSGVITIKIFREVVSRSNTTPNSLPNATNHAILLHLSYETIKENVTQYNVTFTRAPNNTVIYHDGLSNSVSVVRNGSHVWINSGSTIIFPNNTKVTLTNDTYFSIPDGFQPGTTTAIGYKACYLSVCYSRVGPRPSDLINTSFENYSHPGINSSFNPITEQIQGNGVIYANLTISTSSSTKLGTYLLGIYVSGMPCGYEYNYLTIGSVPYIKNASVVDGSDISK